MTPFNLAKTLLYHARCRLAAMIAENTGGIACDAGMS
jgi:hypothetical protein